MFYIFNVKVYIWQEVFLIQTAFHIGALRVTQITIDFNFSYCTSEHFTSELNTRYVTGRYKSRTGSARIDSDQLGSNKKIKIK